MQLLSKGKLIIEQKNMYHTVPVLLEIKLKISCLKGK